MPAIRRLLARRSAALLLCALALLLKLVVPAGYMIGSDRGRVTIELCSGVASRSMTMAMPGMPERGDHGDHGKGEMPCAFSGLATASLGAIDPIQVAAFLAFVMAAGIAPAMLPAMARRAFLRPPLRGPPPAF